MLGYVRIYKPDLKVREYEVYCGYYCGVCKYIGKEYGQFPRMALSYDAAFLAVLLGSVIADPDEPVQEHCVVHHIRKRTVIRNESIEYAGDLMLILAWFKLMDDVNDEGKTSAKAASVLLRSKYRRLEKKRPALCRAISENLAVLSRLESEHCASLDEAAEAFAKIMEAIFREGSSELHETFAQIGYHMGKWIYLIDALDDIEENIQDGAYNPLLYRFDFRGRVSGDESLAGETADAFRARIRERVAFNLYHYLAVLSKSIENLDIKKNKGIIENVIYFGMNRKTEEILEHKEDHKEDPDESI
ncbi:MAG: DUF5685 family protein [Bacillota bacterium]|nr:DUF5685 family protein [Bacillota bacterium]